MLEVDAEFVADAAVGNAAVVGVETARSVGNIRLSERHLRRRLDALRSAGDDVGFGIAGVATAVLGLGAAAVWQFVTPAALLGAAT